MTKNHYSDCAVHNEPAYPKGDCDCGGYEDVSEIEVLRSKNEYQEIVLDKLDMKNAKLRAENARLLDRLEKAHSFISRADWMQFFEEEHSAARAAMGESDE